MKTLALFALFGALFAGIAALPTAAADCQVNLDGTCDEADCDVNVGSNCAYGSADCQLNLAGSECRDAGTACPYNVASGCWLGGTCDVNLLFAACRDDGACTVNVAADCHDGGTCTVNVSSDCTGDCDLNVAGSTCTLDVACLLDGDTECVLQSAATSWPAAWLPLTAPLAAP